MRLSVNDTNVIFDRELLFVVRGNDGLDLGIGRIVVPFFVDNLQLTVVANQVFEIKGFSILIGEGFPPPASNILKQLGFFMGT